MRTLDALISIPAVVREIYGHDENVKPNDHCVWTETGYTMSIMAWVETDKHFRERINLIKERKSE